MHSCWSAPRCSAVPRWPQEAVVRAAVAVVVRAAVVRVVVVRVVVVRAAVPARAGQAVPAPARKARAPR